MTRNPINMKTPTLSEWTAMKAAVDYITTAAPTNTFTDLCNWLNKNECVAFLKNLALSVKIDGVEMGSTVTAGTSDVQIQASIQGLIAAMENIIISG